MIMNKVTSDALVFIASMLSIQIYTNSINILLFSSLIGVTVGYISIKSSINKFSGNKLKVPTWFAAMYLMCAATLPTAILLFIGMYITSSYNIFIQAGVAMLIVVTSLLKISIVSINIAWKTINQDTEKLAHT